MDWSLVINIGIFVVLLWILSAIGSDRWSLSKRVFSGLIMGVLFGIGLQAVYGVESPVLATSISWFNIVGNGYVQLLQMVVMPLVFASILSAVARLHNASSLVK